ncbi:MAG: transglycosylase SLT domain-containing protein [Rhodoglobus sp.]
MLRAQLKSAGGDLSGRHTRSAWSLPLFATFTTLAFVLVSLNSPFPPVAAAAAVVTPGEPPVLQSLVVAGSYTNTATRDGFTTSVIKPVVVAASAPAAGTPDPGTAQAIAHDMLLARGMGEDQYSCLVALWDRESHWNVYAQNSSSGAYGIPQALPGSKMASAGDDWATNPATQIAWGLGYIADRYGTPCGAWQHSEDAGWY